jgi:prephenate dehydratase
VFLWLDVAGHEADGPMAKALARLFTVCGSVRVLGSYPSGR